MNTIIDKYGLQKYQHSQLKAACKQYGLHVTGNKSVLISRLESVAPLIKAKKDKEACSAQQKPQPKTHAKKEESSSKRQNSSTIEAKHINTAENNVKEKKSEKELKSRASPNKNQKI